jgi:putative pre-16S rRNA nuclease
VRVVGLDLGASRIGVAVSDSDARVASPRCTIVRSGELQADHAKVAEIARECGARLVIVGLPIGLDGRRGHAARAAADEAAALARVLETREVGVETFDERFTTVTAKRRLSESGRTVRSSRRVVDQAAAAVMLQGWLDLHRDRVGPRDV